ncbi:IucA/IucC family siderophore biosynthesis protein [Plantactinospora sp. ZYX-F-223]|uniref:IucA/IucC family siderophore biosynthesis protein n=1 Tax=Plantactinospora sp. ZYX-F-223 TaxID=3144103 RepID=UPI0031FE14D1
MTTQRRGQKGSGSGGGFRGRGQRTSAGGAVAGAGADAAERQLFQRVLDTLLREDHLGLAGNGQRSGRWWLTRIPGARLRLPVEPDGFQHELRTARPELVVLPDDGPEPAVPPDDQPDPERMVLRDGGTGSGVRGRVVRSLDGLLDVLAPVDDPEAEAGWAAFRAECRDDLVARRLAAQTRSRVYPDLLATRARTPDGMAGALLDDVLAARADHPVYPTSRARIGLDRTALLGYAPEHAPTFALCWLPVPRAELTLTGALPDWWPPSGEPETVLLPVHPVTADRLHLPVRADVPEVLVRPTLSTRTVALVDDPYTHLKLPLATAALGARNIRTIAPGTLVDGAELHRLLARIAAAEPAFAGRILHADESCYGHAGDPARSFLVRRFPAELAGRVVVPVAALAAEDPAGGTVAQRVAGADPRPLLESYLDLLVDWHGYLWLRHGIALEAHQQNIHLVLDPPGDTGPPDDTGPGAGAGPGAGGGTGAGGGPAAAGQLGRQRTGSAGGGLRLLYKDNDGARLVRRPGPALRDERMWVTDPGELADVFTTITLHLAAAAPLRALAERGVPVPAPGPALRPRLLATRDRWTSTPPRTTPPGPADGVTNAPGPVGWDVAAAGRLLTERVLTADHLPVKAMLTAGTLLPKQRTGCADINKYYLRTGPNYLRSDR